MHSKMQYTKREKTTAERAHELLCKHGKRAFKMAQRIIFEENIENIKVREALYCFMKDMWHDMEYPGLMALSCEAVGGDQNGTLQLGASLVLIRGAMDIHDDIIDQQTTKANMPTLYGKYGRDVSILAGDVLFYEGLANLNETTSQLRKEVRKPVWDMVKNAMFEVGTGVATEVDLRGSFNLPQQESMRIIMNKSACAEVHAKLGAIVGGGDRKAIDALGRYGRLLGVLTMIRDEFIDIYEVEELRNRKERECLPLPLVYALQEGRVKDRILQILAKRRISDRDSQRIVDILNESDKIKELKESMEKMRKSALSSLSIVQDNDATRLLANLLVPIYEDILEEQ